MLIWGIKLREKGRAYGIFRENIKGAKWPSGYFMHIVDNFWRIYFRDFSYSDGGRVIYTCFVAFIILRSYGIIAVLFRDFFVYLALYGYTFLG
jgi:hypothetical protein